MEPDFSGYATKADIRCSDGRTIKADAFAHMDGLDAPLVWNHLHNDPMNVLGKVILHSVEDGVRCDAFFNDTESGQQAKALVEHGDVKSLSIFANQLVEKAKVVAHGMIREVSLVLSGANPGALIDNIRIAHSEDNVETLEDEAIIYMDLPLELQHSGTGDPAEKEQADEAVKKSEDTTSNDEIQHADDDETVKDVYDSFTPKQKDVVHFMIGEAIAATEGSATHSDTSDTDVLAHQEGDNMPERNAFEASATKTDGPTLSHGQLETIVDTAKKIGSFKDAFLAHAQEYGIEDIDLLFPDAKSLTNQPELISRRTEWVKGVIDGAKHSPFSRIKSLAADLTADEARAKGYVKGNLKKDEVVKLLKRVTGPTTVYKKQKLDRDDIVDITDLDVVAWLKWEMRFMLEEELARAILVGDGREPDDDDKIDEDCLRPIAWDHEMYTHPVNVPSNVSPDGLIESVIRARKHYKGTGTPTFYTTDDILVDMLLVKDRMGRRIYATEADVAAALRVSRIVVVEVLEDVPDLLGVMVNMADYTIGADRGGQLSMFDDFDIDYNQFKYLMETRISGCLTKPKSAVVIKRTSGTTVTPQAPGFNEDTNTITIPTITGVSYYNMDDDEEMTGNVVITRTTDVYAKPDAGYNFPHNTDADWTYAYTV